MLDLQVYLLAAGNGKRSGGPKAWKVCGDFSPSQPIAVKQETLLERQLDFLTKLFAPDNIAVSVQKDWLPRCEKLGQKFARGKSIHWVAVDSRLTPLGSLQKLVRAVPFRRRAFMYHVDMPLWEPALFKTLAAASGSGACDAIAPINGERKGHPVLLSPKLGPVLLSLDPAKERLDFWLRTQKESTVEVPFSCIHENWNQHPPSEP